jgi:hypothetical protein
MPRDGLLRFARNDETIKLRAHLTNPALACSTAPNKISSNKKQGESTP